MHDSINLVEKFVGRKHKYLFFALPCHLVANILSLVGCAMTLEQIGIMQDNEGDVNAMLYLVYARTDLFVAGTHILIDISSFSHSIAKFPFHSFLYVPLLWSILDSSFHHEVRNQ